jgi:isoquinoline 1-oxidoreductase beta subunit
MLVDAAARSWGVAKSTCRAEDSTVLHVPSGRRIRYGELAQTAASLPIPEDVPLKDPGSFRILGKSLPRVETPRKVDGSAVFGIDVRVPRMLFASVLRCPIVGGRLESFDARVALRVPGVRHVIQTSSGVGVVADSTWGAFEGRRAVEAKWTGGHAGLSSSGISRLLRELVQKPGNVVRREGSGEQALAGAARVIEAEYQVPYVAHAAMEPMNCAADVRWNRCHIWASTQAPEAIQRQAAEVTRLPSRWVTVHTTFLGGGFGRRLRDDMVVDAVELSKAIGNPVSVVWTREDDIQHDFYRPAALSRFRAGLDADGRLVAWIHRIAAPPIGPLDDGVNASSVQGAADLPYAIPHLSVEYAPADVPVPVGFWRSVGHSQNAFFTECFLDEVAAAAGKDPCEFRNALLRDAPRHLAVLQRAAEIARWGSRLPTGQGRGIAVHFSYGSYVAQVAEVSVGKEGALRVNRVVCVIDCGRLVNPGLIEAQMESSIAFGLSAALKGAITLEGGRIREGNFDDYPVLRIDEMPRVETHILSSAEPPGGVGEPGVPPVAPAVVNAIAAATGRRIRKLPVRPDALR